MYDLDNMTDEEIRFLPRQSREEIKRTNKKGVMTTVIQELDEIFKSFLNDATKQIEKGNKSAGQRARVTSLRLEKKFKFYRRLSYKAGSCK